MVVAGVAHRIVDGGGHGIVPQGIVVGGHATRTAGRAPSGLTHGTVFGGGHMLAFAAGSGTGHGHVGGGHGINGPAAPGPGPQPNVVTVDPVAVVVVR